MQGRTLSEDELVAERARLVALALDLVDREGREAVSVRRLATQAGISRSTPYSYFADKEALIDAVRVAAIHLLADGCEAALATGDDVAGRLHAVGAAYMAFALEHPALYALIFEAARGGPEHDAAITRYRQLAEAPLVEAASLGLTTLPPDRLAHVLWAATHGLLNLQRAGKLRHGVGFETALADLRDVLAFGFVLRTKG